MNAYKLLAAFVDATHALLMLVWGLGLPLLVWHRFPRLSRAYMWFSVGFVLVSVLSHRALGECILTAWARTLWQLAGGYREGVPFIALLTNQIAGFRPSNRQIVMVWEAAVLLTSVGGLWCWHRTDPKRYAKGS